MNKNNNKLKTTPNSNKTTKTKQTLNLQQREANEFQLILVGFTIYWSCTSLPEVNFNQQCITVLVKIISYYSNFKTEDQTNKPVCCNARASGTHVKRKREKRKKKYIYILTTVYNSKSVAIIKTLAVQMRYNSPFS